MLLVGCLATVGLLTVPIAYGLRSEGFRGRALGEGRLVSLIEDVPAASSGRVAYDARDDLGQPLGVLDPIPDPRGGYLGVYDFGSGGTTLGSFEVSLAHSWDLTHWTRLGILDTAANSPSLRRIPGRPGYLLAEEKYSAADPYDHVRVRYYRSLGGVLANRFAAQFDSPRRYSPYADGTPSFVSISWHRGVSSSAIELGFHYLPVANAPGHQGPDREALGTLRGFRVWTTHRDRAVDALLDQAGLKGKHGDRRQFRFAGHLWRVYEGQTSFVENGFANWRIVLDDVSGRRMYPLTIRTAAGVFSTSVGAPIVQVEPAPSGKGRVLVVTMFVFGFGPGEGGELVYYQPA